MRFSNENLKKALINCSVMILYFILLTVAQTSCFFSFSLNPGPPFYGFYQSYKSWLNLIV